MRPIRWLMLALAVLLGISNDSCVLALPKHIAALEGLIPMLISSGNNTYGTSPNYIVWSAPAAARVQCNSLHNHALSYAYNFNIQKWSNSNSPGTLVLFDLIQQSNNYTLLPSKVENIQIGDTLIIKYLDGGPVDGDSTGHVMFVASLPNLTANSSPVIAGTIQYLVKVIDSSASYHGDSDTRFINLGVNGQGVGKGTFRLYVNATTGFISGYTWSDKSSSVYYTPDQRELIVGRFTGAVERLMPSGVVVVLLVVLLLFF